LAFPKFIILLLYELGYKDTIDWLKIEDVIFVDDPEIQPIDNVSSVIVVETVDLK